MASDYQESYIKHGDSPKALKWINYISIAKRYRELVADVDFTGKTVLDACCGMGDLLPYICAKTTDFKYRGVDIQKEFLETARRRYEGFEFTQADVFASEFDMSADIVICSGALNHREDDWLNERKRRIAHLYGLCGEVLVFNMAGGLFEQYESKNIAYANAAEVIEFCKTLSPKIIYRSGYNPKDFTILLFKPI